MTDLLDTATETAARVAANDRRHVFHSWSAQALIDPLPIARAEGSYFWDYAGTRYLDFASQLVNVNIGYQHPKLVAAIQQQAAVLCTVGPTFANEARSEAARLIADLAPGTLNQVFFTNARTEANENAIRLARLHTGRHKILAAYRSYHGATAGSITLTGDPRRWPNEPGIPGVVRYSGPYLYRSPFHATTEAEEAERALAHLRELIMLEGPSTIAAIILEPVVGTNGILVPPDGYLTGVREICDQFGILLIADEVMSGFARCGEWFAVDHWGVVPDLITLAKGLTSSYAPLGAVGMRPRVAAYFDDHAFYGGLTYNSHPLGCAAALGAIQAYEEDDMVGNARRMGDVLARIHRRLRERHACVGAARSIGLFGCLELVRDRQTLEPLAPFNGTSPEMKAIAAALVDGGMHTFVRWNTIMTNPPLCIAEAELEEGFEILDSALEIGDRAVRD